MRPSQKEISGRRRWRRRRRQCKIKNAPGSERRYERRWEWNEAGLGFRARASIRGPAIFPTMPTRKTMPGICVNALFSGISSTTTTTMTTMRTSLWRLCRSLLSRPRIGIRFPLAHSSNFYSGLLSFHQIFIFILYLLMFYLFIFHEDASADMAFRRFEILYSKHWCRTYWRK